MVAKMDKFLSSFITSSENQKTHQLFMHQNDFSRYQRDFFTIFNKKPNES